MYSAAYQPSTMSGAPSGSFAFVSPAIYFDERLTAREQVHWEVVIRTQPFQNEVTRHFQYDLPAGAMIHPLA